MEKTDWGVGEEGRICGLKREQGGGKLEKTA
jgi:hypothetical protein